MAEKIIKFFEKKKAEAKFKKAGPGHKLSESSVKSQQGTSGKSSVTVSAGSQRVTPSEEAKQAAAAALARLGGGKRGTPAFNTSLAAIQAQVKRELEAEKKAAEAREGKEKSVSPSKDQVSSVPEDVSPLLAVRGVYFKCPLIGQEVLSKEEWNIKIKEFLYEQLAGEKGLTACLIIHSCNKNKEKIAQCVETLSKYLDNIVKNPDEEKYRKIRLSNRVFQDKVAGVEGAMEFLEAAGFEQTLLPFQDTEEPFLLLSEGALQDLENLQVLTDALHTAEPIGLELDRNMQVLLPSQAANKTELPPQFFTITAEEMKREQQLRSERVDSSLMLRTKAMREKDERREMKKYKFSLIRIRFPDGILLQGTFGVYEKLGEVFNFVQEHISSACEGDFVLTTGTGNRLTETDLEKTLLELHLVPASILLFIWTGESPETESFLLPEVMLQLQSL